MPNRINVMRRATVSAEALDSSWASSEAASSPTQGLVRSIPSPTLATLFHSFTAIVRFCHVGWARGAARYQRGALIFSVLLGHTDFGVIYYT